MTRTSTFHPGLLAGLFALAAAGCDVGPAPDVGTLDAVFARPAEKVEIREMSRGETLGEVLATALSARERNSFLASFRTLASPRRMRSGTEITFRYLRGDGGLRAVDVALDSDRTVRLQLGSGGWAARTIETPTFIDTMYVAGTIETVLWNAVVRNPALQGIPHGDRVRLLDHLDAVFQWQVDFTRQIRVGDTYRFAFEREVRPDGSMRAGRLLAAELVNSGTPFHAIWFDPEGDGLGSYFDLDGQSVRRAFLLKPLEFRRISSRFSSGRFHPVLKRWRAHRGVDYAADAGTPIMATSDGVVIFRGVKGGYGNAVEIRHANGFITRYAHLSRFDSDVKLGSRVRQSTVIGYVGMTGLVTGPHLHYEMIRGGKQIDPLSVDLPAGSPVPTDDRDRWIEERTRRITLLESIPGGGPVRSALPQVALSAAAGGG